MARIPPAFALADWGTTHLRVWLVDADGHVLAVDESAKGMGAIAPDQFAPVLDFALDAMGAPHRLPVMICGMAGARQGWREAAYADCPIRLDSLADRAIAFESNGRPVRIMPGVARRDIARPDVMRGEETQLLGLAALTGMVDGIACLPGTHSKWVRLEGGRIADFATGMTGELFALLSRQSILRHSVGGVTQVSGEDPAFIANVAHGLAGSGGLSRLFSVRAASLLNGATEQASAAALSGLLIGAEIRGLAALIGASQGPIAIISSGALARLYASALTMAGYKPSVHQGEETVRAGLLAAARILHTQQTGAVA
ncbi:MAG: 2-dehydro-3-deoxygalactonokinase [Rhizobiaceae bacterium]|nr:2-dehydro-3-deoxygalactonokinase [Rhizobiaceae bacterium]